ncbi:MAG: DUF559 domain-containing protein [Planctomycetaceae bacterium]|nr:DUF559 domain-containing protein [Planctomycetaceae bacterium]
MSREDPIEFARRLRKSATSPESYLWQLLRNRQRRGMKLTRRHAPPHHRGKTGRRGPRCLDALSRNRSPPLRRLASRERRPSCPGNHRRDAATALPPSQTTLTNQFVLTSPARRSAGCE